MDDKNYMTAGELARKVGVTIRTVQYYDQAGLLKPSARSKRNQRLYGQEELEIMYRIRFYKTCGLSLDEIREQLESEDGRVLESLHREIRTTEEEIQKKLKKYAVLKNLESFAEKNKEDLVWEDYVNVIHYIEEKWKLVWELNRLYEEDRSMAEAPDAESPMLKDYFGIVAEAIHLMRQGQPADSPEARQLVKALIELNQEQIPSEDPASQIQHSYQEELRYIDPDIMHTGLTDYSRFWTDIKAYLKEAVDIYMKEAK